MEIRSELNYFRSSPRKVRRVADAIRGKSVSEAEAVLRFVPRRTAEPMAKLLKAAIADAKQNFQVTSPDALVVSRIMVDGGPTLKRSRPRAMGRAFPIRKRTSHVVLVLEGRGPPPAKRRRRKADIAIVRGDAVPEASEAREVQPKHDAFRVKPKIVTKPTDFVQRMFRRKAI